VTFVVRGERNLALVRRDGARHEILIPTVVVAEERPIAEGQLPKVVLDDGRGQVDIRPDVADVGIPIVGADVDVDGPPLEGGDPAIGHAVVLQVLVVDRDFRRVAIHIGEGWRDARATEVDVVAEAAGILIEAVQAKRELIV
jgi:hypothetical protein